MNQDGPDLPVYQHVDKVYALKIKQLSVTSGPSYFECKLIFEDARYPDVSVEEEWYKEYQPFGGGYYVWHEFDNDFVLASFWEAENFEKLYTLTGAQ